MFNIGDKVKAINEPIEGIIVKIQGNRVFVSDDSFDYPFNAEDLIKVDSDNSVYFKSKKRNIEHETPSSDWVKRESFKNHFIEKRNKFNALEVDLHVQAIIEIYPDTNHLNALKNQLLHAKKWVEIAKNNNERKLIFIHGVGEGILKNALISWAQDELNLKTEPANFQLYGFGATEIYLK